MRDLKPFEIISLIKNEINVLQGYLEEPNVMMYLVERRARQIVKYIDEYNALPPPIGEIYNEKAN